jgi:8-oxo-dGTP pyrophosphatase MutT (NUDIX family)
MIGNSEQAPLARFLRAIPRSDQPREAIAVLAGEAGLPMDAAGAALGLLAVLGAIDQSTDEPYRVRAVSQIGWYTLHSLADFVARDARVVDDWQTRGVTSGVQEPAIANGVHVLHMLERRRVALFGSSAAPVRDQRVALVLIVDGDATTGGPRVLFQRDAAAGRDQLIGGRHREADGDLLNTATREIDEELPHSALQYPRDYALERVIPALVLPPTVSPTFGALTRYTFTVFALRNLRLPLILGPDDHWIPGERIVRDAEPGDRALYAAIDEALPGGWAGLQPSAQPSATNLCE